MIHNIKLHIFILVALSILFSCKKKKDDTSPTITPIDKGVALFDYQSSIKDTLTVKRDKLSAYFRISANTQNTQVEMKRLYIFKRILDDSTTASVYSSLEGLGATKDAHNNFYYSIPPDKAFNYSLDFPVALRALDLNAIEDEYYFTFTNDADFTDPFNPTGVVIGPIQLYVKYGKLIETKGIRLYNHATTNTTVYSNYDVVLSAFKLQTDAAADIDLSEKTTETQLFLGKFKSLNNTTFVKAPANFPYSNATDTDVETFYKKGTPFSETPDSVGINDVYLLKLRGADKSYAAIKFVYLESENGKVGNGNNNEYFIFNVKK